MIVLGHLLAEGNLCHPHGVYYYTTADDQLADYVENLEQFSNTVASVARHRSAYSVYSKRLDRTLEPGVVRFIKTLGLWGTNSHTKHIPPAVFRLNNRQIALLISRMWEGDGHINETGRSLFYATASERLARQLQHLLLRLGMVSRLRQVTFPYKEGRIGYQVFITGQEQLQTFAETIAVHFASQSRRDTAIRLVAQVEALTSSRDVIPLEVKELIRDAKAVRAESWQQIGSAASVAVREFYPSNAPSKSGYTRGVIGRLAEHFNSEPLRAYAYGDVYWDSIVAIEYVGEKPTYDLTVADSHNFVANDFIVHNSHAADYAVITCQTAFLKTHYPVEYMTALLSVQRDDTSKVSHFTAECRRMGIPILSPDVNRSALDFSIEPQDDGVRGIRYGLAAIKNAGTVPMEHIIGVREEGGPFKDLADFCRRVDLRVVQKRALESLGRVGALKDFGTRPQLLGALDRMLSYSADQHRARDVGQLSLFGAMTGVQFDAAEDMLGNLADVPEASQREMLNWEKELVGLYVSSHPLDSVLEYIQNPYSNITQSREIKDDVDSLHDKPVAVVGLVEGLRTLITKKGDPMAIATLEDLQGQIDAVLFPRTWRQVSEMVQEGNVIRVAGKVDGSRGDAQIIVDTVTQNFSVAGEADATAAPLLNGLAALPAWLAGDEEPPEEGPPRALHDEDYLASGTAEDRPPARPLEPPPGPYVAPATAGAASHAPDLVPQPMVDVENSAGSCTLSPPAAGTGIRARAERAAERAIECFGIARPACAADRAAACPPHDARRTAGVGRPGRRVPVVRGADRPRGARAGGRALRALGRSGHRPAAGGSHLRAAGGSPRRRPFPAGAVPGQAGSQPGLPQPHDRLQRRAGG